MRSDLAALGAVFLWASLATLAISLYALPPLLMTGIGLLIGSLISVFLAKNSVPSSFRNRKFCYSGCMGCLATTWPYSPGCRMLLRCRPTW